MTGKSQAASFSSRARPHPALWIALLVLAIHGRVIGYPFLGDDEWQIGRLPASLSREALATAWTTDYCRGEGACGVYRPLLHTVWLGEAAVMGRHREAGVHALNLALLFVIGLVFLRLLERVGLPRGAALAATGLMIAHPAGVEVVSHGVGQGEQLTVLLTLLCLSLTRRLATATRTWPVIALIAALFFAGTVIKELMFPMAAVIVALAAVEGFRQRGRVLGLAAALGVAGTVSLALRVIVLGGRLNPESTRLALAPMGAIEHGATALALLARYAAQALAPQWPAVEYRFLANEFPPTVAWWSAGLAMVIITAALTVALWRRGHRRAVVAAVWAGLALLPVLHLVPMGSVYASRHLWPALFPLAWAGAWAVSRISSGWPHLRVAIWSVVGVWFAAQTIIAFFHVGEHRDGVTLWRAAAARHPESATAHQNLAMHLLSEASEREDPSVLRGEALAHVNMALTLDPGFANGWATLGRLELDERNFDDAEEALRRALDFNPLHARALFDLGILATTREDWAEARRLWQEVLLIEPHYPNARVFLERLPTTP